MPAGGFDSWKFFEALRIRPWRVEVVDGPRLREGSIFSLLGRRGVLSDGGPSAASFWVTAAADEES